MSVGTSAIPDPCIGTHWYLFFTYARIYVLSRLGSCDFDFFFTLLGLIFFFNLLGLIFFFTLLGIFVLSDDPSLDWVRDFEFFGKLPLFAKYFVLWGTICRHYLALQNPVTKNEKPVTKAVTDVGGDGEVCVW